MIERGERTYENVIEWRENKCWPKIELNDWTKSSLCRQLKWTETNFVYNQFVEKTLLFSTPNWFEINGIKDCHSRRRTMLLLMISYEKLSPHRHYAHSAHKFLLFFHLNKNIGAHMHTHTPANGIRIKTNEYAISQIN